MGSIRIQKRILVVCSDRDEADLVRDPLEKSGSVVLVASNGRTALDILRATDVDVIISESEMPVMDGSMLHSIFRSRVDRENIPFVFFTDGCTPSIVRDPNTFVLRRAKGIDQLAQLVDTFN